MNKELKDIIDALNRKELNDNIRNSPEYRAIFLTYNDETIEELK